MPPLPDWDTATIGAVFLLNQQFDAKTRCITQTVHLAYAPPVDDKGKPVYDMKREIEFATFELSDADLPTVELVDEPRGTTFKLTFPKATPVITIPAMVEIIVEQLEARLARHEQISRNPLLGRVVYSEIEHH